LSFFNSLKPLESSLHFSVFPIRKELSNGYRVLYKG
jgi:hypothetical protein